jgi:hypothetical protein
MTFQCQRQICSVVHAWCTNCAADLIKFILGFATGVDDVFVAFIALVGQPPITQKLANLFGTV